MRPGLIAAATRGLFGAGLLVLAACTTTRTIPVAPIPLPDPVRVVIDEEGVDLHHPYLEDGDLVGWQRRGRSDSTLVRVPYEQEVIELDERRSLFLGLGALALAVALVAIF